MRIFISYSYSDDQELAVELTKALSDAGHVVFEPASSLEPAVDVAATISTAIRGSDLLIALLAPRNPNVLYEVGLAAGAHVPMLVASRNGENIVFDLSSVPYVELSDEVAFDVAEIVRRVERVSDPQSESALRATGPAELTLAEAASDPAALESVSPQEFERLVAEAFEERGFSVLPLPTPADRGFDLILDTDPVTVVEVKRYSRRSLVSVGTVRQLLGSMAAAGAGRAILVSSAQFTESARAAAAGWPVELMTLEDLLGLPGPDTALKPNPGAS